jgi:D-alanyl-D-alanine carboxypeptidase/D-alanyl-D-alanine-endopeptidase (penicillin-binding protein 4)
VPTRTEWDSPVVLPTVDPNAPGTGSPLAAKSVAASVLPAVKQAPGPVRASVVDVATGVVLARQGSGTPAIPASTMKLVTALSVGQSMDPQSRLKTQTLLQGSGQTPTLVLRGAGDSSLMSTQKSVGADGTRIRAATTKDLAARTAKKLKGLGVTRVRLSYDATLFTGPTLNPDWQSGFPAAGVVAPVSALMVDSGHVPGSLSRYNDPAAAAARTFARQLQAAGITVVGEAPTARKTAQDAQLVASVSSPTIAEQVERMLSTSDNDLAEALSHLAAKAAGMPASFTGAVEHSRAVLEQSGIDVTKVVLRDGSGLSRRNRLTASVLAELLVDVARASQSSTNPSATAASAIRSGLSVAGATGSLRARFHATATKPARGLVRAKTGTLTGVIALAGFASRPDGRLVAFAFLDNEVSGLQDAARSALELGAAKIVTCDCEEAPAGSAASSADPGGPSSRETPNKAP